MGGSSERIVVSSFLVLFPMTGGVPIQAGERLDPLLRDIEITGLSKVTSPLVDFEENKGGSEENRIQTK